MKALLRLAVICVGITILFLKGFTTFSFDGWSLGLFIFIAVVMFANFPEIMDSIFNRLSTLSINSKGVSFKLSKCKKQEIIEKSKERIRQEETGQDKIYTKLFTRAGLTEQEISSYRTELKTIQSKLDAYKTTAEVLSKQVSKIISPQKEQYGFPVGEFLFQQFSADESLDFMEADNLEIANKIFHRISLSSDIEKEMHMLGYLDSKSDLTQFGYDSISQYFWDLGDD